jgi:ADP-ribose pyrophosphatase YjhB (NUDIX family)
MPETLDRQRLAAYGVAVQDGCVLLARAGVRSDFPGTWSLPGGGVDHGEHPEDAATREFLEETGLVISVDGPCTVFSDVREIPTKGIRLHHVRLCYPVTVTAGTLRSELEGATDLAQWIPFGQARNLDAIAPFVTSVLETTALEHSIITHPR